MIRTLNEVFGMVLKAARGAGVPLGHCEDLAYAASYLGATDPAALAHLPDILGRDHAPPSATIDAQTMQIGDASAAMAAPLAVDAIRAGLATVRVQNAQAPQIIFAHFACQGIAVTHRFDGADLILSPSNDPAPPAITKATITLPDQLWHQLSDFAANTYVPATEASRLAGAGAGLTDND